MPILIDELIVEAEPPRAPVPPQQPGGPPPGEAPQAKTSQGDRMLELSIVADRHRRLQVD
jgi:hypothetical protein